MASPTGGASALNVTPLIQLIYSGVAIDPGDGICPSPTAPPEDCYYPTPHMHFGKVFGTHHNAFIALRWRDRLPPTFVIPTAQNGGDTVAGPDVDQIDLGFQRSASEIRVFDENDVKIGGVQHFYLPRDLTIRFIAGADRFLRSDPINFYFRNDTFTIYADGIGGHLPLPGTPLPPRGSFISARGGARGARR